MKAPKIKDPLEHVIQKQIKDVLEAQGYLVLRMQTGPTIRSIGGRQIMCPCPHPGIPDYLAISPTGEQIWIEVKTKTGILSDNQKQFHAILSKQNQKILVTRSVDELIELLFN